MSVTAGRRSRRNPDEAKKQAAEKLAKIRTIFEQARAYDIAKSSADSARHLTDSRWEALRPVLRGELPLLISADELLQIQSAVQFAVENKLKLIIYGGYDAPLCADLLKKFDIPVIVSGTHRLPLRKDDAYDTPYTVPARLAAAGVKFAISDNSDSWNARNLPYSAAMAAAYGLDKSAALRAITLTPAEIFGVADILGSLDPGKHATLFIANGDPLEIPTQVERAWIQGCAVDLRNRQTMLNEKYKEKLERRDH
jgi:imidazolonepropionase-like amidohydrolase